MEVVVKIQVSKVLNFRLKLSLLLFKLAGWIGTFKIKEEVEFMNVFLTNDELICASDCLEDFQRDNELNSKTLETIIDKLNVALRGESKNIGKF